MAPLQAATDPYLACSYVCKASAHGAHYVTMVRHTGGDKCRVPAGAGQGGGAETGGGVPADDCMRN
eukprot:7445586-Alexandrium_andersonii.AAC.1